MGLLNDSSQKKQLKIILSVYSVANCEQRLVFPVLFCERKNINSKLSTTHYNQLCEAPRHFSDNEVKIVTQNF